MDETHDADTDEIARMRALWCEETSLRLTLHAEVERLRAENAALKADLIAEQGYRAAAEEIATRRGEMVDALIAERDALAAELAALKKRLAVVGEIARLAPELNPNNYDHDEVCELNDAMIALAKEAKP